jgi:rfaE bifunctional protein kinase chain/domain/rfaE bifunctional protein nucleotidyltransferase chain/domain
MTTTMAPSRKICTLDGLLALREQARRSGRTLVHCHGCFDIVHPGHIHHLQFARSVGDLLVVSVSADTHVNKGVNRPLIPDDLRAASVAALECVDAVYVNPDPTAAELLERLRPDVYVKGREYERSADPRFHAERDTVVRHGGRVVFSGADVVYSSTALIGTLGGESADPFRQEKLARYRERHGLSGANLQRLVREFRDRRVLVVGDFVLDRYHFCDATGVAGEGPMLALRSLREADYDGGAGVVAMHLAGLGARPVLFSSVADDELSRRAEMRLEAAGVDLRCARDRRELVIENRFVVDQNKLFKVDQGGATPPDSRQDERLARQVLDAASDGAAAAVVFADFGYGLITAGLLDRILPELRKRVPVLAADVRGRPGNLLRFKGVDLLCPSEREARAAQHNVDGGLGAVAWNLLNATGARQAIVTLGKQGLVTFDRGDRPADGERLRSEYIPALAANPIDPLGCGDALLATATLALAAGGSLQAAAFLGSIAAAAEARQLGNQPIDADEVLSRLDDRAPVPVPVAA